MKAACKWSSFKCIAAAAASSDAQVFVESSVDDAAPYVQQSVGVVVLPGSALSRYSDYTLSGAQLFASQASTAGRSYPGMASAAASVSSGSFTNRREHY